MRPANAEADDSSVAMRLQRVITEVHQRCSRDSLNQYGDAPPRIHDAETTNLPDELRRLAVDLRSVFARQGRAFESTIFERLADKFERARISGSAEFVEVELVELNAVMASLGPGNSTG